MALTATSLDSSTLSTLFSGMGTTSSSGSSASSTILSDYYSIQNGSYYKMMKAYYNKVDTSDNSTTSSDGKDSVSTLNKVQTDTTSLKEAANALQAKGSKSLFDKKTTTATDGTTTTDYDTDAIYNAVKKYADSYNSTIVSGGKSSTTGVLTSIASMTRATSANANLLSKVGITVGSDNKLSIDEDTFKKANMDTVKSLFNSTGGYGYSVSTNASMAYYYASNEASAANGYTSSGGYTVPSASNVFSSYV